MKNSTDKIFSLYLQQKEGSSSKYEAVGCGLMKQKENVVNKGTWQCLHHSEGTPSLSYHISGRLRRAASPKVGFWIIWIIWTWFLDHPCQHRNTEIQGVSRYFSVLLSLE